MEEQEIVNWFDEFYKENGKISRLNVVRMRPESHPLFVKGCRNTAHVLRRDCQFVGICEGESALVPPLKLDIINTSVLEDFGKVAKKINNIFDVTVFFQGDKCGIFLIEKQL